MCIHIESTSLADGTYELVPEPKSEQRKVQINLTKVIKDPNQNLVEPKASTSQEGKPWSINSTLTLMQLLFIYGIVH
jgi:hypothetical protein